MQIELKEVKDLLLKIYNLFDNTTDMRKHFEDLIKIKDEETQDYLHELELANLNGIEMSKIAKKLKNIRKERRELKNQLEIINTLKGYTDKYVTKGILPETKQVAKNLETLEKNQKTRAYTPRVVKDLKCAKKEKCDE